MALPTDFAEATSVWPALSALATAHGEKAAKNLHVFLADLQESDPDRFVEEYTALEAVWGGSDSADDALVLRERAYEMSQSLASVLTSWDASLFAESAPVLPPVSRIVWLRFAAQLEGIAYSIRSSVEAGNDTPGAPTHVVDYTDVSSVVSPSERPGVGRPVDNRGIVI